MLKPACFAFQPRTHSLLQYPALTNPFVTEPECIPSCRNIRGVTSKSPLPPNLLRPHGHRRVKKIPPLISYVRLWLRLLAKLYRLNNANVYVMIYSRHWSSTVVCSFQFWKVWGRKQDFGQARLSEPGLGSIGLWAILESVELNLLSVLRGDVLDVLS